MSNKYFTDIVKHAMNSVVKIIPERVTPVIKRIRPGNGVAAVEELEYTIDKYGSKLTRPRYTDLMK